jgi:hypothetical protein
MCVTFEILSFKAFIMRSNFIVAASSLAWLAECSAIPTINEVQPRGGMYLEKRQEHGTHGRVQQMEWWNYANSSTQGATADGKYGVILEPDLIVGTPGIDGGIKTVGKW